MALSLSYRHNFTGRNSPVRSKASLPHPRLGQSPVSRGWEEPTPLRSASGPGARELAALTCGSRHGHQPLLRAPSAVPAAGSAAAPRRGSTAPTTPPQRNMDVRGGPSLPSCRRPTISSFPHRNHSGWTATEAVAPANRAAPQTAACISREKHGYSS